MNQDTTPSSIGPMLWTFLAGAAVGAAVVALTTPKSGPELRSDLKDLARRARRKAGDLADDAYGAFEEFGERAALAAKDLKRSKSDVANDVRT